MISITAGTAKLLANPSIAEELQKYEEEVSCAIKEAALAGIKEIVLRIPMHLRDSIIQQLFDLGYTYQAIENKERMSFFRVNWGN